MTDSEFFKEVCQWHDGNCRKSIKWGDKGWACCSKSVCPSICPLKKVFPDRCSNPPDVCKYFLCNVAKIYIMQHPRNAMMTFAVNLQNENLLKSKQHQNKRNRTMITDIQKDKNGYFFNAGKCVYRCDDRQSLEEIRQEFMSRVKQHNQTYTMFPQKVGNKWSVVSWNRAVLHARAYSNFLRAVWEYNKQVRVK